MFVIFKEAHSLSIAWDNVSEMRCSGWTIATFQRSPQYPVGGGYFVADKIRAESEMIIQRIEGYYDLGQRADVWKCLCESKERWGLHVDRVNSLSFECTARSALTFTLSADNSPAFARACTMSSSDVSLVPSKSKVMLDTVSSKSSVAFCV